MNSFRAAVFDWAGTTVDFGCFAPTGAFIRTFEQFGIEVGMDEARAPMGAAKLDHIRAMLDMPAIAAQWEAQHGAPPDDAAAQRVHAVFVPMNEAVAAEHATLVPGVADVMAWLRARGMKIGSTTGYTRSIMEHVLPVAAAQGYAPDTVVCSDDLPEGRPAPLGMYRCFVDLGVYPPAAVLKVDDTAPGIAEGLAAGCVTVGVALSGNAVGRTPEDLAAMTPQQRAAVRRDATDTLTRAGADHVIDTVADLPALIDRIETRS